MNMETVNRIVERANRVCDKYIETERLKKLLADLMGDAERVVRMWHLPDLNRDRMNAVLSLLGNSIAAARKELYGE